MEPWTAAAGRSTLNAVWAVVLEMSDSLSVLSTVPSATHGLGAALLESPRR